MTNAFGRVVLRPSMDRDAAYDSQHPRHRRYPFPCAACGAPVVLDLETLLVRAGDERVLGEAAVAAVREHFALNLVGKAHDGGWPRFAGESCERCGTRYLVYLGVREPANGWFRVTVQGISELRGDPPAA